MKFEADEPQPVKEVPQTDDRGVAKWTDEELDSALSQVKPGTSDSELYDEINVETKPEEDDAEEDDGVREEDGTEDEAGAEDEGGEDEVDAKEDGQEDEVDERTALQKRIDELNKKFEASELLRERQALEAEKHRLRADTQAGRLGSLLQQLEKGEGRRATRADDDEESGSELSEIRTEIQRDREERRVAGLRQAIESESQDFYQKKAQPFLEKVQQTAGDDAVKKVADFIRSKVDAYYAEYGDELLNATPKTGKQLARLAMESAMIDAREQLDSEIAELARKHKAKSDKTIKSMKRATQTVKRKGNKAVSASSGIKPISQMSDKELDAVIRQGFA